MDRIYLATIELDNNLGRGILAAERQYVDDKALWHIIALLPDGTEENTEVNTRYDAPLAEAVETIAQAWGSDTWKLEWIPSEEETRFAKCFAPGSCAVTGYQIRREDDGR